MLDAYVREEQLPQKNFEKPLPVSNQKKLEAILKKYKVELMSATGESEEYIRIFESFPEMKEQLRDKYQTTRDRKSKLLGNIKAIQTALAIQSEAK